MIFNVVHSLLREAKSINGFGLFSLLVFFGFFTAMLFWVFRLKKNYLNHMGDLPLDAGETVKNSNETNHL